MPLLFRQLHVQVAPAVEIAGIEEIASLAKRQEYVQWLGPWQSGRAIKRQTEGEALASFFLVSLEVRLPHPRCGTIGAQQHVEVTDPGEILSLQASGVQVDEAVEFGSLASLEQTVFHFSNLNVGGTGPYALRTALEERLVRCGRHEGGDRVLQRHDLVTPLRVRWIINICALWPCILNPPFLVHVNLDLSCAFLRQRYGRGECRRAAADNGNS